MGKGHPCEAEVIGFTSYTPLLPDLLNPQSPSVPCDKLLTGLAVAAVVVFNRKLIRSKRHGLASV